MHNDYGIEYSTHQPLSREGPFFHRDSGITEARCIDDVKFMLITYED